MAIIKRNVLGSISGKIDNVIVRQRYGKEILYHMPDNYNISYSEKAVAGRKKFGYTVKLARLINSNPDLSAVWKTAKCKGINSYQKIIKNNSSYTTAEGVTQKNIITPTGLYVIHPKLIITGNRILIETELEKSISRLLATMYPLFSFNKASGDDLFLIASNDVSMEENKIKGELVLDNNQYHLFSHVPKSILLCSFIFKDTKNKIIAWTNSFSFEINNPT